MSRKLTPNRWNWSQEERKWVYIELDKNGDNEYYYQIEPPQEFIDLTLKIKDLNERLLKTNDPGENERIFAEMMMISKKMQCMRKENT
jgi:hypothetical protein